MQSFESGQMCRRIMLPPRSGLTSRPRKQSCCLVCAGFVVSLLFKPKFGDDVFLRSVVFNTVVSQKVEDSIIIAVKKLYPTLKLIVVKVKIALFLTAKKKTTGCIQLRIWFHWFRNVHFTESQYIYI
jgi:hypothetical protein